jgi:hypothetical protein
MNIEISIGEALDKLSIIGIKMEKIKDEAKLDNVAKEYYMILDLVDEDMLEDELYDKLKYVNRRLWDIEDEIRVCEKHGDFNLNFIRLARAVYHRNDERADIKRQINLKYNSNLIEEKHYQAY